MITRTLFRPRAALIAVAAIGWSLGASAQMTTAGTSINNRATVNYSVGGLTQAPIESSPTGNTTPGVGAGANTSFLVDNLVDLSVSEVSGNATIVTPGMTNGVLAYRVLNEGNFAQGYQLTVSEETGTTLAFGGPDNANIGLANVVIRVDEGNGLYDGTESATAIDSLNPNQSVVVFVVSPTVPLTLINGNNINLRLQARTAVAGTSGATLQTASAGVNNPTTVEVLFADPGFDATEFASDQFAVQTAGLTITKAQSVLADPFGSASPRAVPGAFVEYQITIQNTSTTTAASSVSLSDLVPTNTALRAAQYAGKDVGITGGTITSCTADANDGDADGCGVAAGLLTVGTGAIGSVAANSTVTVRFQVTIN